MNSETYAELKGAGKQQPVFEGLQVRAELREALAVTTIIQSYSNPGEKNIEAVYTFPLPLDAVLLDLTVTLGGKTLKGVVLPKQEAEARYEDAIIDGNAPVMLQNPQPGVYTMNVGNLLPGEKAAISIQYGMFMCWQGDALRYHLPTTIAPRYGIAEWAGLLPHQAPETSLLVDNLFDFTMKACGTLAAMAIESPSHDIAVARDVEGGESSVRLLGKSAFMDRDLIITVRREAAQVATATVARDGGECLLWGSFQPQFGLSENASPRSVKLVVDCSGSMGGDSIAQAREALYRILDELRPQDWFNIIAFGSTVTTLFAAQTKADKGSLDYARGFLKKLDADMGGTEIGNALVTAVRLRCPEKIGQDVLLITDGEIWEWEKVVGKAVTSNHRFFTVGVGSSVSEAFVKTLAERTGGACELVSPGENMAERIHRHAKRISSPRFSAAAVSWPVQPVRGFPEQMPPVYDGDTLNLFAWFSEPPVGEVLLSVSLPDGTCKVLKATVTDELTGQDAVIPRMAAALQLRDASDEKTGQELAVRYQLVSRWTNYLAVVERGENCRADTLPELHTVQQMLAAGWGGFGSARSLLEKNGVMSCLSPIARDVVREVPTFCRERSAYSPATGKARDLYQLKPYRAWDENIAAVEHYVEKIDTMLKAGTISTTIHLLLLPAEISAVLEQLVKEGTDERAVVTVFLHYLAGSAAGSGLSRQAKRVISKAYKELHITRQTASVVENRLREELSEDKYDVPTFLRIKTSIAAEP